MQYSQGCEAAHLGVVVLTVGMVQPGQGLRSAGRQVHLQKVAAGQVVGERELELPLQQEQRAQVQRWGNWARHFQRQMKGEGDPLILGSCSGQLLLK